MGRIIAVVLVGYITCVLSNVTNTEKEHKKCDMKSSALNASRNDLQTCFKDIVWTQVDGNSTSRKSCSKPSDFGKSMAAYGDSIKKQCNATLLSGKFVEFVEFSLSNNTFKEFYADVECFKAKETEISQCVKSHVGFFNITETKMHSWLSKILLTYDERTCTIAEEVKNCTVDVLKPCKPATSRYVASLFEFSQQNCVNITDNSNAAAHPALPLALLTIATSLTLIITMFFN